MGIGSKIKSGFSKVFGTGPLAVFGLGKGGLLIGKEGMPLGKGTLADKTLREIGHGVGYLTGVNAMEKLAEAQTASDIVTLANAEKQAQIAAGNVLQTSEAGTQEALSKILSKKSALARTRITAGQPREGRQTLG